MRENERKMKQLVFSPLLSQDALSEVGKTGSEVAWFRRKRGLGIYISFKLHLFQRGTSPTRRAENRQKRNSVCLLIVSTHQTEGTISYAVLQSATLIKQYLIQRRIGWVEILYK